MLLGLLLVHPFLARISGSPVPSAPMNATNPFSLSDFVDSCDNIHTCRTLYTIVWSSLVTILACVWTAVHRNLPRPAKSGDQWLWHVVVRVLEAVKIVGLTLLVPEWVLAWAARQFLNARAVGKQLELARAQLEAARERHRKRTLLLGNARRTSAKSATETVVSQEDDGNGGKKSAATGGLSGVVEDEHMAFDVSMMAVDERAGRLKSKWTTRHGFFIIMGGFHYYVNGEPRHPLYFEDVLHLVRNAYLVPPTEDEIRGWSQGDALSKTIAVIQTLWSILQGVARHIEHRPITQLEVMTLAYTTMTVAMYVVWWYKPKNVGSATRVAVKTLPTPKSAKASGAEKDYWFWHAVVLVSGMQDPFVDLRTKSRIPTFYSGGTGKDSDLYADIFALAAAMVFGAIHCAAWSYTFPSDVERLIWRVSSVAIIAIPGLLLSFVQAWVILPLEKREGWKHSKIWVRIHVSIVVISVSVYIAARMLLIALAFTTLRSLPYGAYESIQWNLLIPHFA
ncbi:hypothetical protein BV25DRAFT_1991323 [Artomyces pyxidatus]|uniref:Uncharacterized protein n=1 Tax=Artomyces pyxidatus TaxID=48021 RepID=A0ACB8T3U9_9AGAM|nr:hypothetical protein BV25DRAFT_1991323 [Artomyces pyxidatus]